MTQTLRVKVVLDTDQLHSWAARHHDLGVLTTDVRDGVAW